MNSKPAKWSDFGKWLKAEHLQARAWPLTLARVEVEETHPRAGVTELSPVAYFRETNKALVLTPTNQRALAALFGDDITAAIGQRVTVQAEAVRVAGRDRQPIRISAAAPAAKPTNSNGQAEKAAAPAQNPDDF